MRGMRVRTQRGTNGCGQEAADPRNTLSAWRPAHRGRHMTELPSGVAPSAWRVTSVTPRGLANAQIASRLGRSPATIAAYFYDPTGEKSWAGLAGSSVR